MPCTEVQLPDREQIFLFLTANFSHYFMAIVKRKNLEPKQRNCNYILAITNFPSLLTLLNLTHVHIFSQYVI